MCEIGQVRCEVEFLPLHLELQVEEQICEPVPTSEVQQAEVVSA